MKCKYCNHEIEEGMRFCENCGKEVSEPYEEEDWPRFCSECGARLSPGFKFCENCGAQIMPKSKEHRSEIGAEIETIYAEASSIASDIITEGKNKASILKQQIESKMDSYKAPPSSYNMGGTADIISRGEPLEVVQQKMNGESVSFYEDHLVYGETVVKYSDIRTFSSYCKTSSYLVLDSIVDGHVSFMMKDGSRHKINVYGGGVIGIGTAGGARERWRNLVAATDKYVAKYMADMAYAQVRIGGAVDISCVDIRDNKAIAKGLFYPKPVVIDRNNFGSCYKDGYNVIVRDKQDKKLLEISDDVPNASVLVYLLPRLFG